MRWQRAPRHVGLRGRRRRRGQGPRDVGGGGGQGGHAIFVVAPRGEARDCPTAPWLGLGVAADTLVPCTRGVNVEAAEEGRSKRPQVVVSEDRRAGW